MTLVELLVGATIVGSITIAGITELSQLTKPAALTGLENDMHSVSQAFAMAEIKGCPMPTGGDFPALIQSLEDCGVTQPVGGAELVRTKQDSAAADVVVTWDRRWENITMRITPRN